MGHVKWVKTNIAIFRLIKRSIEEGINGRGSSMLTPLDETTLNVRDHVIPFISDIREATIIEENMRFISFSSKSTCTADQRFKCRWSGFDAISNTFRLAR